MMQNILIELITHTRSYLLGHASGFASLDLFSKVLLKFYTLRMVYIECICRMVYIDINLRMTAILNDIFRLNERAIVQKLCRNVIKSMFLTTFYSIG